MPTLLHPNFDTNTKYIHIFHPVLGIFKINFQSVQAQLKVYCRNSLNIQRIETDLLDQENTYLENLNSKNNSKKVLPFKVFEENITYILFCVFLAITTTGNVFIGEKPDCSPNGFKISYIKDLKSATEIGEQLLFLYLNRIGFIQKWDKKSYATEFIELSELNVDTTKLRDLYLPIDCEMINGLLFAFHPHFSSKMGKSEYNNQMATFFLAVN